MKFIYSERPKADDSAAIHSKLVGQHRVFAVEARKG